MYINVRQSKATFTQHPRRPKSDLLMNQNQEVWLCYNYCQVMCNNNVICFKGVLK